MYRCETKIRKIRKERGETQAEVAKKAGMCEKTIYRYERERVKAYNDKTIEKFANYYGVDPAFLIEEEENEK